MSDEMNEENIDLKIREALARGDAELNLYDNQQSLFQQTMQIFQGRNRWINSTMAVVSFLIFVFTVYAGVRFYQATEFKEVIGWSMAIIVSTLFLSMLKIWAWLEMEKYSMIREIKRVELQVARLVEKV